jgi:hypothetical protein
MACGRFRDAVTDVAAGAPAPAAVEVHLAACEACRAELATLRQALARADAELAGLAAAEPSPELAVRIRQAVADSPPAWRFGWLWPAAAVAATLLVAFAVWLGRAPTPEPGVAAETTAVIPRDSRLPGPEGSATPADPSSPDTRRARREDRAVAVGHRQSPAATAVPTEPEVLVPAGEEAALLRLVALVHRERLAPAALAAVGEPSADLPELPSVEIEPLEIVPLDPAENQGT